jgi:hypothetical protein
MVTTTSYEPNHEPVDSYASRILAQESLAGQLYNMGIDPFAAPQARPRAPIVYSPASLQAPYIEGIGGGAPGGAPQQPQQQQPATQSPYQASLLALMAPGNPYAAGKGKQ